jgi:predicted dithiol-disulfide oxidoreductase (DUF899 family)
MIGYDPAAALVPKRLASEEWLKARLELLAAEKEFTRQRHALTRRRMAMPWERVEKSYRLKGQAVLSRSPISSRGRSQLIKSQAMHEALAERQNGSAGLPR